MSHTVSKIALICLLVLKSACAQTPITTTVSALTDNNTSASDKFPGTFNGNATPGNISSLPITSLLSTGNKTRYIAHLVPFFSLDCGAGAERCHGHYNVGYDQSDPTQVARQVADMYRRGFTVVLQDWYGQDHSEKKHNDETAKLIMHEAERIQRTGTTFNFVMQPDHGIVDQCPDAACNTARLIEALKYQYTTYESSPAYLRWYGRPVVPFFWNDTRNPVDWEAVKQQVPGNPLFIFQNSVGFSHPASGGSFSWVGHMKQPGPDLGYLDSFYQAGAKAKEQLTIGSAYAGFDDRLAYWGLKRIVVQRCGLTWLDSMRESLMYLRESGTPLPFLQIVTWNDYEEGTALEVGISNCVSEIPMHFEGSKLFWKVNFGKDKDGYSGSEDTIAYFRIFVQTEGENLQELKSISAKDKHELDITPFHLKSGKKVYIQAVGKTMIQNHLSVPVSVP
jgi:hypothetical protein